MGISNAAEIAFWPALRIIFNSNQIQVNVFGHLVELKLFIVLTEIV